MRSEIALRKGIDNTVPRDAVQRLEVLCVSLLEPIRHLLGVPMHINSGYRCPELNKAVGGAKDSAHMRGEAADFVPVGMSLGEAFDAIRYSALMFDQIIIECDTWIHIAIARPGAMPRRQALKATGSAGRWSYVDVGNGIHPDRPDAA